MAATLATVVVVVVVVGSKELYAEIYIEFGSMDITSANRSYV